MSKIVYDSLVWFNLEFGQVRIQILGKQEVLCCSEVVSLIQREKSRRGFMAEPESMNISTMVARGGSYFATNMERAQVSEN